jgi:hypothetical protein
MTVGIILLVGTSHIYLGVHYPSDVARDGLGAFAGRVPFVYLLSPGRPYGQAVPVPSVTPER